MDTDTGEITSAEVDTLRATEGDAVRGTSPVLRVRRVRGEEGSASLPHHHVWHWAFLGGHLQGIVEQGVRQLVRSYRSLDGIRGKILPQGRQRPRAELADIHSAVASGRKSSINAAIQAYVAQTSDRSNIRSEYRACFNGEKPWPRVRPEPSRSG